MTAENNQAKSPTVAYLGPEATFTHQAALRRFGNHIAALSKDTIAEVFEAVDTDEADYGVVPVENSTEGAVTVTFDLFGDTGLQIGAEIYLQIHHYLLARPKQTELHTIYSHPQVFGQCRRWLQQNLSHCEWVETSSTTAAGSS